MKRRKERRKGKRKLLQQLSSTHFVESVAGNSRSSVSAAKTKVHKVQKSSKLRKQRKHLFNSNNGSGRKNKPVEVIADTDNTTRRRKRR